MMHNLNIEDSQLQLVCELACLRWVIYLCILGTLDLKINKFLTLTEFVSGRRVAQWKPTDQVNPEELGAYFQGDILIAPDQKNGLIDERYRWPNGVVAYDIDSSVSKSLHNLFQCFLNKVLTQILLIASRTICIHEECELLC